MSQKNESYVRSEKRKRYCQVVLIIFLSTTDKKHVSGPKQARNFINFRPEPGPNPNPTRKAQPDLQLYND